MKKDHDCFPSTLMSAQNLGDARRECSKNPSCTMFNSYNDRPSTFRFCKANPGITGYIGANLYVKKGNKTYILMFKEIL